MKKFNSKGFTLVELLVAITILGIVLVIALPQVSNLQTENAKTKYKKYAESVVSSAKLYTDSYSKDMFGNNSSGCYDIPYSALSAKSLVKDIKIDNSTCDTYAADKKTSLTFVRVYKSNENYLYDISIKCNDKNGKEIYNESLEKDICDGTRTDTEGPTISISVNSNWTTGKDASGNALNATVKIRDPYGLKENVQVEYAWTKTASNISGLTFKTKKFTNSRTELVQELSFKVQYPQNENGEWYLVVRPAGTEGLRDANGNYYSGGYEKSAVVRLDNTKPTIDKTTNSHNGKWTADQVTISATASDTLSGVKKIYYTYKSDGSSLKSDWAKSFAAGSRGPVEVNKIWTTEINETVYVVAEDMVGNKSTIKSAGTVQIDKAPPAVPKMTLYKWSSNATTPTSTSGLATYSSGSWSNKNIYVVPSGGSDNASGKVTYQYTTTGAQGSVNNKTATSTSITNQGTSTIKYRACDQVGNCSAYTTAATVKLDKTVPTCASSGGNAAWTTGRRTLTGTCSDTGGSGCKSKKITKPYSSDINSTTESPGTVYDNAGNSAPCPANQTVRIDKTAPSTPTGGAIGTVSGSSTSASIKTAARGSTDNGSGLKRYLYLIKTSSGTPNKNDSRFTTSTSFTRSCGTTYYAYAVAEDNAGNRSAVKSLGRASDGVNKYSGWSTCSNACGSGTQRRTNSCALVTKDLSRACSSTSSCCSQTVVDYYGSWSACSKTCDGGTQTRDVYLKSSINGQSCGKRSTKDSQACNTQKCCSESNPTGCPQYHSCREGTTFIFDKSDASYVAGTVVDTQTLYKIKETNGKWYVYVPDGGNFHNPYWQYSPKNYGYIYSNCIEPIGVSCTNKQCPSNGY